MEHIKITKLSDKLFRLVPDEGYILVNKVSHGRYSEAVTSKPEQFEAAPVNNKN